MRNEPWHILIVANPREETKREFPAIRTSVINVDKYLPSATVRSASDSVSSSKKDLVYSLKKDKQEV